MDQKCSFVAKIGTACEDPVFITHGSFSFCKKHSSTKQARDCERAIIMNTKQAALAVPALEEKIKQQDNIIAQKDEEIKNLIQQLDSQKTLIEEQKETIDKKNEELDVLKTKLAEYSRKTKYSDITLNKYGRFQNEKGYLFEKVDKDYICYGKQWNRGSVGLLMDDDIAYLEKEGYKYEIAGNE